ncbi:MAG: pyruvate formate lyase-activating protein [Acholeplasmataceae bacterium]|nr:pyruvate formate lyase-activating protein [Acholeplasmataceae bacterium]
MNLFSEDKILGNIHSIETFGTFDGPGIRYVLFLQGCPFRCQYCHNRDTWSTNKNINMSVEEVLHDFEKYSYFYKNGGITVSGGEALLQLPFVTELFKTAKERNIHTCLDTSAGCYRKTSINAYEELLKYTDLVLLDIKHMDDQKHMILTKSTNKHVLEFAVLLDQLKIPTIIRHVLIPTITDDDKDLKALRDFTDSLTNIVDIEVLPYHSKGIKKWNDMGILYELAHIKEPTEEMIDKAEYILKSHKQFKK